MSRSTKPAWATQKRPANRNTGKSKFVNKLNRLQSGQFAEAISLFENREFEEAEGILLELNDTVAFPAVIEMLINVYAKTGQYFRAAEQAHRLVQMKPYDPAERLCYASAVMYAGFATIALNEFREFLRRWPRHESVDEVRDMLQVVAGEAEKRIASAGFPSGPQGMQLQVLHEEALLALQCRRFEDVVGKCEQLLKVVPEFCPARNNLALGYFQSGQLSAAVEFAEATTALFPANIFAKVLLAKLRLLSGELEQPKELIVELLKNPPTSQDAAVLAAELLAMLGCDEELLKFVEVVPKTVLVDPVSRAMFLHYEAYGHCRLGKTKEAKKLWEQSIKILPHGTEAQGNLAELRNPVENAFWPCSMQHWIPSAANLGLQNLSNTSSTKNAEASTIPSHLTKLLPIFLDRGDPALRQLAVALHMLAGSPESLEAVKQFGLSSRGSDSTRHQALMSLVRLGYIDKGPHQFYSNGRYVSIKLVEMEIYAEAIPSRLNGRLHKVFEDAYNAMNNNNLDVAEQLYEQVLKQAPECTSAEFNLATIWLFRDGQAGEKRARTVFEAIHRRDPDYIFAGLGLAQMYSQNNEHDKATELLRQYADRERMHYSEAKALFAAQLQIANKCGNIDSARSSLMLLENLCGADDPQVIACREILSSKSAWSSIKTLFK
jgi:tetratricopeptide (TPR) repeat protein